LRGDSSAFSNTSTLNLTEPNGSYRYSVSAADRTYAASGGSFAVAGTWTEESVAFSRVTYNLSFTENGLPGGVVWSVSLGNESGSGVGTVSFRGVTNGTYRFTVASSDGFAPSPETGYVIVSGLPGLQVVAFAASPSSQLTFLGLPAPEGYALLGGITAALVVVSAVAVLFARRRKVPPSPRNPRGI
jgi:hypothetical protein